MLKIIICFLACTVKFSFSIRKDNTRVCYLTRGEKTQLRCCQGYRLDSNSQDCIDCPNGTYGVNCKDECSDNYYGLRCNYVCRCFANETCNKAIGCVGQQYVNYESSITTDNVITSVVIVTVVAVLGATAFVVSWKCRHRLKSTNPINYRLKRTHPVFARSRQNSTVNIEDDDHYSEIRESMMVRPMTVNGRKLSIRSSYIDSDDSNDQYHRIELATSLQKPNLKNSTNEYTTLIVEPFLQPKNNNIYEQLLIDESTESQRNTDNAIQARVVKNHSNACSPQKDLNTTEYSDKFNSVTEGVYTEDNVDNCTERETTAYSMQMPLNLSYISDKTDFVTDIQISSDNTTYAKEVKNSANECSSKLHLNTSTGIPDNLNFVTNNNGEINEINIESKAYTEGNEGDMTTEIEFERKNRSDEFEENNSNTKVVLNKITNNMVTLL